MTRAHHGDKAAWEMILAAKQGPILAAGLSAASDPDEANDATPEAVIWADKYLHRFDAVHELRP